MNMIERVARAICSANREDPDRDEDGNFVWREYVADAISAIEAMRDLDDDLITVACDASDLFRIEYMRAHEAMIDAALREAA